MAVILDVDETELRNDIRTPYSLANKAYNSGKTLTKLQLRKQETELAKVGSPLGIENCRQALMEMEDDE